MFETVNSPSGLTLGISNPKLNLESASYFATKPPSLNHTLVKRTILPILDFGNVIYKIASNTLLSKLDGVYHSAIRFVTKSPYTTLHCDLYVLVGWPSLHIRRQTHWLQVIYTSLLGKARPYLSSLVTIATPTRIQQVYLMCLPQSQHLFGCLSFQLSAANDWNKLQKKCINQFTEVGDLYLPH